jgi:hypothetical protein
MSPKFGAGFTVNLDAAVKELCRLQLVNEFYIDTDKAINQLHIHEYQ